MYQELVTAEVASDVLHSMLTTDVCRKVFRQKETHVEQFQHSIAILSYNQPNLKVSFIVNFFQKVCLYRFEYRVLFDTISTSPDKKVTRIHLKNKPGWMNGEK